MNETNINWLYDGTMATISTNDPRIIGQLEERHRQEMEEVKAQANALRQIRDNPEATPGERLEAIKMLEDMKKRYVII